jgi:hypothetical protein
MSAENTLESLRRFCFESSGDASGQTWQGNAGTYQWTRGKTAADGIVNGVVRKLVGTDVSGSQIWAVAGSFKISPTGAILRFTGLPKKLQTQLTQPISVETREISTVPAVV